MKKLLMSSIVLTIFALSITFFQISCQKEAVAETPVTLSKEQILTQKAWKVDQLHHVIGCSYSSYVKGGANTTGINYDNLGFKFNTDGTGTHTDQNGNTHSTTWKFASADKRSIRLTVNLSTPISFTWDMVEIADKYLHASVNLIIGGNSNNIETFRLIQVP